MPKLSRGRQYKKPPSKFGNVEHIRDSLGKEQQAKRKKRRTQNFEENRKIAADSPCSSVMSQNDELRTKLLQPKEKQTMKKKAQESQKKPPFVVGIVRHRLYSPVSTTNVASMKKKKTDTSARNNSNIKRGITKATEKRLLAKAANAETKQKPSTKTLAEKPSMNDKVKVKEQASFAPLNHKFKPPAGLSNIHIENSIENNNFACDILMETAVQLSVGGNSGSIEAITLRLSFNEEKTLDHLPNERTNSTGRLKLNSSAKIPPLRFSLHIEIKRQSSPHKLIFILEHSINTENDVNRSKQDSVCKISGMSNLPDKLAEKDDKMNNPDGSMEEKKYSVEYFIRVSDEERNNLEELCKKWAKVQSQGGITDDVYCQINQTIGQTNMLIKEKFKQFQCLIENCKRKDGNVFVTCMDLHGFWDMMYIEVKDCVSRFAKLEELRARFWQEDQSFPVKSSNSTKKKIVTKKDVSAKQNSPLILSAKKKEMAEMQDTKNNSQEMINVNNECVTPHITNKRALNVYRNRSILSHGKRLLEIPTISMHTSTPFSTDVRSNISNQLNLSLVTLKVNQLYNKTLLNDTLSMTPKLTPRTNLVKKLEASPIHITRNISSKITPNIDRTSRQCNSSMKRSWDKTIISDGISNVSRKIETRSSKKENTN